MKQLGFVVLAVLALFLLAPAAQAAEEDTCPATAANGAVTQLVYKNGHVEASGTWEVSGGATGAMLEFRIDNERYQAETRTGTSGTWSIVQSFNVCDRPLHALRVLVYPSVSGGEGRLRHCLKRFKRSEFLQFEIPCGAQTAIDHCAWECEGGDVPRCAALCAVTATGGRLPYLLFQGTGDANDPKVGDSSEGSWTVQTTCKRGEKLSFYVRDFYGRGRPSPRAEKVCGEE
jgi:hypothetical protein